MTTMTTPANGKSNAPLTPRQIMGLSVEDFAREMGVPTDTVRAWESGSQAPQTHHRFRIKNMVAGWIR
jgi:DNA-binding transcriptional regulator YiaG